MTRLLMKLHLNNDYKGQASIEFSLAFILALFFLVLTCRLFVALNGNMINRQQDYENTRVSAGSINPNTNTANLLEFHAKARLDILSKEIFKNEVP